MNRDRIEGQWTVIKGSIKKQWGKLTNDDLDVINGSMEKLVGKIQNAYGISQDEAKKQYHEWEKAAKKAEKDAEKS